MSHCQAWKYVASPRKWGSRVILTVSLADLFQPSWTEPLDWQGHHNVDLQHLKRLSLTLSRTITGPHVQLPSTKMLLHVSNTNKPSLERWQTSRTERRYSSNSVFSGTQHAADWCWGWPYGKKRVVTVQEKSGVSYIEIIWHCSRCSDSTNWQSNSKNCMFCFFLYRWLKWVWVHSFGVLLCCYHCLGTKLNIHGWTTDIALKC